jgi:hypothetical protein
MASPEEVTELEKICWVSYAPDGYSLGMWKKDASEWS